MPIKVLLAEDSESVRRGIRQVLSSQDGIEIVGECADFCQTIRLANELQPEVIVMDLHMPDETNIVSRDFSSHLNHGSQLVAISIWNDEPSKRLAESFGAVVLLDKMGLGETLIPTIVRLCRGRGVAA
jgi:DNA-binding NarL/FixJ family response regulator